MSVTATTGGAAAIHIQGEATVTVTTATVTADVWWVGGKKKCAAPEAAAHFLILYFCELDLMG